MKFRSRAASVAIAAALTMGAASSSAVARPASPLMAAKSCSHSYTRGVIGGVVKCLRRGEYCALSHKSQYVRYGFRCYGSPARLH